MSLIHGDCLEVMAGMEPESVDAIVTDPPYGLEFMGKAWDKLRPQVGGRDDLRGAIKGERVAGGTFKERIGIRYGSPNKNPRCRLCYKLKHDHEKARCRCPEPRWDERKSEYGYANQWWHQEWAEAAYRVAKPSSYLLAFGGTRTVHRMTCALEDAGWIVRDMLVWGYASGFPKSKASLKPAWEPIVMARKPGPLRMLAIDECRIGYASDSDRAATESEMRGPRSRNRVTTPDKLFPVEANGDVSTHPLGRWPANVILTDPIFDGGIEGVVGGGETTVHDTTPGGQFIERNAESLYELGYKQTKRPPGRGDSGTYSRFFLIPKSSRSDREPVLGGLPERELRTMGDGIGEYTRHAPGAIQRQNVHPTVKPTDLMRHLVRLVTPTGGTVLDPFLGSGTTALAAEMEGFGWVGIEREAEYVAIAEARLNGIQRGLGLPA